MNLYLVSVAVIAVCGIFALERQLQMLQQNSYFAKRYYGWLKGAFSARTVMAIIFAVAETIAIIFDFQVVIIVAAALSLIRIPVSLSGRKKSIKPLVFTPRVKRMFACAAVVFAVLTTLGALLSEYIYIAVILLANLAPLTAFLVLLLMKPAEKMISNKFLNEAKALLKQKQDMLVLGVTGSFGKTSVKYILGKILNEKYNVLITPENFNTPMGIVRTVRERLEPQHEVFVAEMGAKRVGDIKELCELANPDMGIITSVGSQHLETFGSLQNIASTKFELADHVVNRGGNLFVNIDSEGVHLKVKCYPHISYGQSDGADYRAHDITYSRNGLNFKVTSKSGTLSLSSKLLGAHNAVNITGAVAVAKELGIKDAEIIGAVSKLEAPPHRLQMKRYIGGSILIDDAYNSNQVGCLEAARVLGSFDGMKRILVTPGLVELGEMEEQCNRDLGCEAAKNADVIILVGEKRAKAIADGVKSEGFDESRLHIVGSFKEAMDIFAPMCDSNTVVMFENDLPDNYL